MLFWGVKRLTCYVNLFWLHYAGGVVLVTLNVSIHLEVDLASVSFGFSGP